MWLNKNLVFIHVFSAIAWLLSLTVVLYWYGQRDFSSFLPWIVLAWGAYFLFIYKSLDFKYLFALGLLARLLTLGAFPSLSDDIYRFFWDGSLTVNGFSPYGLLPQEALDLGIAALNENLYQQLNSPDYFTIYPPINQLFFAISAFMGDIKLASVILKLLILGVEVIGIIYILRLFNILNINRSQLAIWWLNPLVIIESYGNVHFELVMFVFIIISVYYYLINKHLLSGSFLAIAIGVKLLPLMLIPYFLHISFKSGQFKWVGSLIISLMLIFLPLLLSFNGVSILNSVDLYFRSFEFNASIYYLLRSLGLWISGYNLISYIGPLLAVGSLYMILKTSLDDRFAEMKYFGYAGLAIWTIYLLLTTTVHPWYVLLPLGFSMFTKLKFAIVWSFLVMGSYTHYSFPHIGEKYYWIFFEYLILMGLIYWELKYYEKPLN